MKIASLDLGSNSFLCLIAETDGKVVSQIYQDECRIVRLSEGVATTGLISLAALDRARVALTEFKTIIDSHNVEKVIAVTTAVARQSKNASDFLTILHNLNIPIELLTGDEEADATFIGATSGLKNKNHLVVVDIGGASTEIVYGNQNIKMKAKSFDFGVVRLKDKFNVHYPMSKKQAEELSQFIDGEIKDYVAQFSYQPIESVVAVAGTPTTLASMEIGKYIPEKVDGYNFSYDSLNRWFDTLSQLTPKQILENYTIEPGRADVITIGVLILCRILKQLNFASITVLIRGVRYGVALQFANGDLKK